MKSSVASCVALLVLATFQSLAAFRVSRISNRSIATNRKPQRTLVGSGSTLHKKTNVTPNNSWVGSNRSSRNSFKTRLYSKVAVEKDATLNLLQSGAHETLLV